MYTIADALDDLLNAKNYDGMLTILKSEKAKDLDLFPADLFKRVVETENEPLIRAFIDPKSNNGFRVKAVKGDDHPLIILAKNHFLKLANRVVDNNNNIVIPESFLTLLLRLKAKDSEAQKHIGPERVADILTARPNMKLSADFFKHVIEKGFQELAIIIQETRPSTEIERGTFNLIAEKGFDRLLLAIVKGPHFIPEGLDLTKNYTVKSVKDTSLLHIAVELDKLPLVKLIIKAFQEQHPGKRDTFIEQRDGKGKRAQDYATSNEMKQYFEKREYRSPLEKLASSLAPASTSTVHAPADPPPPYLGVYVPPPPPGYDPGFQTIASFEEPNPHNLYPELAIQGKNADNAFSRISQSSANKK